MTIEEAHAVTIGDRLVYAGREWMVAGIQDEAVLGLTGLKFLLVNPSPHTAEELRQPHGGTWITHPHVERA